MALIKCPECGHDVSDMAPVCPNCGFRLIPKDQSQPNAPLVNENQRAVPNEPVQFDQPPIMEAAPIEKPKKPVNKKLIIGIIIVVCICVVAGLFYVFVLNSARNRAERYYAAKDADSFSTVIESLSDDDKAAFDEKANADGEKIFQSYLSGDLKKDDAISQLSEIEKYTFDDQTIDKYKSDITEADDCSAKYATAKQNADDGHYVEAYKSLSGLNSEYYPEKDDAEKLKQDIKESAVNEALTEAQHQFDSGNFAGATSYISDVKKTDLLDGNADASDKLEAINKQAQDALAAAEEARKAQEAAEKELSDGDTVKTGSLEVTLASSKFTNKILPGNTSGYYFYFEPNNPSNIYYDLKFNVKNTSSSPVEMENIFGMYSVSINGNNYSWSQGYTYPGSDTMENIYSWDSIASQDTAIMHVFFEVPSSAQGGPVNITLSIGGTQHTVTR